MKFIPVFLLMLILFACKDQPAQPAAGNNTVDSAALAKDTVGSFLPIQSLIQQDIRQVDSFAGGILRKTTINGRNDSVFVKPPAFHQVANAFLIPELESGIFRKTFTETSFMDETVGQVQFVYTPKDPANTLRNVIAYITPSTKGDKVSRFYLERSYSSGDTAIHQKLTWKTQQYFYIVTIKEPNKGNPTTTVEKMIWDPEQFGQ